MTGGSVLELSAERITGTVSKSFSESKLLQCSAFTSFLDVIQSLGLYFVYVFVFKCLSP